MQVWRCVEPSTQTTAFVWSLCSCRWCILYFLVPNTLSANNIFGFFSGTQEKPSVTQRSSFVSLKGHSVSLAIQLALRHFSVGGSLRFMLSFLTTLLYRLFPPSPSSPRGWIRLCALFSHKRSLRLELSVILFSHQTRPAASTSLSMKSVSAYADHQTDNSATANKARRNLYVGERKAVTTVKSIEEKSCTFGKVV